MKYNEFAGVYSLLLTPFKWDKSIDYKAYEEYVAWQASFKPEHLFAVCGSSEMTLLTPEERIKCAGLAVKNANGVPVFATTNLQQDFENQVEEMKAVEAQGITGHVFVTKGMCNKPEAMFDYLTSLASYTDLPVVLYEFPGMQPHCMDSVTYGKLAATGKFKGVKDTTCSLTAIKNKIEVQGESNVLQANIPLLYDAYLAGARGVVATPTSCGADLFVKMWAQFSLGDTEGAEKTHREIILLDQAIDSGFNASAKYLCHLRGVNMGWYTRGDTTLGEARKRSIEVFYDYAKANHIFND
ncbi:MAG: dihydrodipicolinate synthase family protein [Clostridiales bacterium]|nr:dihydrodipicolinate synthase family protein [Clostridiales bacterium]